MLDKILICLAVSIPLGSCALVPFITPCKWDDSNCIRESSQKAIPLFADGMPDFKVNQLDPMKIASIDASSSNLKLMLTDVTLTGLKGAVMNKISRDIENSKLDLALQFDGVLKTKYDMQGKLALLPIEGNGDASVKIDKMVINVEVDLADKVAKDGKKHWVVKAWKHNFDLLGKSEVKFENLFPGNEFLRKTTNDFIASNGNEIVREIGPPISQVIVQRVVEDVNNFFKKVPVDELAVE